MASKLNLINWYKIDLKISKQKLKSDRKELNDFWIMWEKNKLFIKRLFSKTVKYQPNEKINTK